MAIIMAFSATICDRWQIDSKAPGRLCKHSHGNVENIQKAVFFIPIQKLHRHLRDQRAEMKQDVLHLLRYYCWLAQDDLT